MNVRVDRYLNRTELKQSWSSHRLFWPKRFLKQYWLTIYLGFVKLNMINNHLDYREYNGDSYIMVQSSTWKSNRLLDVNPIWQLGLNTLDSSDIEISRRWKILQTFPFQTSQLWLRPNYPWLKVHCCSWFCRILNGFIHWSDR